MQCGNQPFQNEAADFYMCKHIVHVRPYKVSQQPVSIHLPITRLLAGVFAFALYLFGSSLIQYLTICLFLSTGLYVLLCRTGAIDRLDVSNVKIVRPLRVSGFAGKFQRS